MRGAAPTVEVHPSSVGTDAPTPSSARGEGDARLLVVAGLKREASLLAGRDLTIVLSGGVRSALEDRLAAFDPDGVSAVISFGLAGALDPALPTGAVIVPDCVVTESGQRLATRPALAQSWRRRLPDMEVSAFSGAMIGIDRVLVTAAEKAEAYARTGAAAVDMESHVAAEWAARHGKPFAVLRVVSDTATHDMPPIVARIMRPDGGIYIGRLVSSLLRDPRQIAGLVRTGRDFGRALEVLGRVGGLLDDRSLGGLGGGLLGLDLR